MHATAGELCAACGIGGGGGKAGRVGPAADTEEDFKLTVVFLEDVELFEAAIEVDAGLGPAVGGVVLFEVGVGVGEVAGG